MNNDELFQRVHDKIRELDIKRVNKEITFDERDDGVEQIQLKYETGPGMKNELAWLEWNLKNVPMSPARKQAARARINKINV